MAISVDPITGEIFVPRADMPIIQASPEIRALDTAAFWVDLKDWEASVDGAPWTDTQQNFPSYVIAGFTYVQSFLIIPPYFITFEDGQYSVALQGTNNNIIEVATANQVRILSQNSAGNISQPKVDEVHKVLGLNADDPVEIRPTGVDSDSGDINVDFSGDGVTLTRMERQ